MVRIIWSIASLGMALAGCNERESLLSEQKEERQEMAQEHTQERQELQQQGTQLSRKQEEERQALVDLQRRELERQQGQAQQTLQTATGNLQDIRARLRRELTEVNQTMALACRGVSADRYDACPIRKDDVISVTNSDKGIVVNVRMASAATEGFEQLERAVTCYQARIESRATFALLRNGQSPNVVAPSPNGADQVCVLDTPGVSVDVVRVDNGAAIQLWSDEPGTVVTLRNRAGALTAQQVSQL